MKKLWILSLGVFFLPLAVLAEARPLKVVATTETFADLARTITGEEAEIHAVASPKRNVHFIEPTPKDVLKLKKADLFIHAGLDLELWRLSLVDAAGNRKCFSGGEGEIDLSKGIRLLEVPTARLSRAEGDIHIYGNPHYWLGPENARVMATTIFEKMKEADPQNRERYEKNLSAFLEKLEQKIREWKNLSQPFRGVRVVTYHKSLSYFAEFVGLEIAGYVEPRPGIPPTAKHLAELSRIVREKGVKLILKEPYFENETPKRVAKETGAIVLEVAHGVRETKEAVDYFSLFGDNIRRIREALQVKGG